MEKRLIHDKERFHILQNLPDKELAVFAFFFGVKAKHRHE